jgi:uncharacterized protein (DUF1330 family)
MTETQPTNAGPVHFLAHLSINDRGLYRDYVKGFFPLLAEHGGRFLAYDDEVLLLEGDRENGRTVLIEFDSEQQLLDWWNSEAYRELAAIRQASCTTHSVIVVRPTPSAG